MDDPEQSVRTVSLPKRILVADDDITVRDALAAVLESEGYTVDKAADGNAVVRQVVKRPPDLVLLDLNMPHLDGWATLSELTRQTPLPPIIVITARPHQYEYAVRLGVDAFMEKPLNIPVLLASIRRLVNKAASEHGSRIANPWFLTSSTSECSSVPETFAREDGF